MKLLLKRDSLEFKRLDFNKIGFFDGDLLPLSIGSISGLPQNIQQEICSAYSEICEILGLDTSKILSITFVKQSECPDWKDTVGTHELSDNLNSIIRIKNLFEELESDPHSKDGSNFRSAIQRYALLRTWKTLAHELYHSRQAQLFPWVYAIDASRDKKDLEVARSWIERSARYFAIKYLETKLAYIKTLGQEYQAGFEGLKYFEINLQAFIVYLKWKEEEIDEQMYEI